MKKKLFIICAGFVICTIVFALGFTFVTTHASDVPNSGVLVLPTPTPLPTLIRLDPANPLADFSVEGTQGFTPTPTLLVVLDQSISDVVNFYGVDPNAASGIELDLFATFQIRNVTPLNADTGVNFVVNTGNTGQIEQWKAVMARCIINGGVKGIGLASGVNFPDPANYPVFVPVDWTQPTRLHIRRTAAGDAEIMEVNGIAPSPRAVLSFVSLPPRNRITPTIEFGAIGVEALVDVEFLHIRAERPVTSPTPTPTPASTPLGGINGKIVYAHNSNYFDNFNLWMMDNNGANKANLTNTSGQNGFGPVWSPDGTKIAFEDGNEIYKINSDGTGRTQLTNTPGRDTAASWSPDGSKIAFMSQRNAQEMSLYVMNADGTNHTRITTIGDDAPAWSPDGTKLVFETQRGDVGYLLNIINADGTGRTDLEPNIAVGQHPAWSPDGSKIAFTKFPQGQIYVMNTDGTGQTRLTNNTHYEDDPAWSPDGAKIVFDRVLYGQYEVFSMNANGTGEINLSAAIPGEANFTQPNWQRVTPTAANVSVSGRVLTANGNGIRNVFVKLTDPSGATRRVISTSFGYFRFDDVEAGQTYVVSVQSKRYQFSNSTQVISVGDEISDLVFTALP